MNLKLGGSGVRVARSRVLPLVGVSKTILLAKVPRDVRFLGLFFLRLLDGLGLGP